MSRLYVGYSDYAGLTLYRTFQWWTRHNSKASAAEFAIDDLQCLVMYVVHANQRQLMRLFVWQLTRAQVAGPTTDQDGDVHEAVRGKPESCSWRSTLGSLPTLLGAWLAIVKTGGRYNGGAEFARPDNAAPDQTEVLEHGATEGASSRV